MSKIDPIYVYNKHRAPVSTMCFGELSDLPVIVTGCDDGEMHVWNLINYSTLIKIQIHSTKIIGLESYRNDEHTTGNVTESENQHEQSIESTNKNAKEININATTNNQMKTGQTNSGSKSRQKRLRFISQAKNVGLLTFIDVREDEQIVNFEVQKEIRCSNCTFCPFQVATVGTCLFIVCISSESNNAVNLVIIDGEVEILNERILTISKDYGMISSMRMKMNESGSVLLMLGTESGACLAYGSRLDSKLRSGNKLEHELMIDQSQIESFKNGFYLKFEHDVFRNTFVSSIELNDTREQIAQLICGSVEDCLAVLNLEFIDPISSDRSNVSDDLRSVDLFVENANSKERLFSAFQFKLVDRVKYLKLTNKGINAIVKREDNKLFATCGWDGRIRIFSLKSMNALAVLTFHKQTIETIKFSPYLPHSSAYLLAAASQDKLVTLWSIYNC